MSQPRPCTSSNTSFLSKACNDLMHSEGCWWFESSLNLNPSGHEALPPPGTIGPTHSSFPQPVQLIQVGGSSVHTDPGHLYTQTPVICTQRSGSSVRTDPGHLRTHQGHLRKRLSHGVGCMGWVGWGGTITFMC